MKRNMLAILILAVSIVNLAMSAFMMLTVMNTNSKTVKLISDVAAAVNIDNATIINKAGSGGSGSVPMDKTALYDLNGDDKLTIALLPGEDGSTHYAQMEVTLSMNTESEGYKTYGETMDDRKSLIKAKINEIVGSYTLESLRASEAEVKQQILEALQTLFDSDFIFKVDFLAQYA